LHKSIQGILGPSHVTQEAETGIHPDFLYLSIFDGNAFIYNVLIYSVTVLYPQQLLAAGSPQF
jgi:hypothetical protein